MTKRIGWMAVGVVFAAACGDATDGDNPGRPIATLTGSLTGELGGAEPASPYVGIIWVNKDADDESSHRVGQLAPLTADALPATFEFDLLDPPPADRLFDVEDDAGAVAARMAMGWIVAVDDGDGDGAFSMTGWSLAGQDRYLGIAWLHKLVWIEELVSPEDLPAWITDAGELRPGFNLLRTACAADPDTAAVVPLTDPVDIELQTPVQALDEAALDDSHC